MYASEPQAVPTKRTRAKYREGGEVDDLTLSNNIMFDRRVVRGNTYAAQVRLGTPVGVGGHGWGRVGSTGALSVGRLERSAVDGAAAAVHRGSSRWWRSPSVRRRRARPSGLRVLRNPPSTVDRRGDRRPHRPDNAAAASGDHHHRRRHHGTLS